MEEQPEVPIPAPVKRRRAVPKAPETKEDDFVYVAPTEPAVVPAPSAPIPPPVIQVSAPVVVVKPAFQTHVKSRAKAAVIMPTSTVRVRPYPSVRKINIPKAVK